GDPNNARWRQALGHCRTGVAEAAEELGDSVLVRRILEPDIARQRATVARAPEDRLTLKFLVMDERELCQFLVELGELRAARPACARAHADLGRLQAMKAEEDAGWLVAWLEQHDAAEALAERRLDDAADAAGRAAVAASALVGENLGDDFFTDQPAAAPVLVGRIALAPAATKPPPPPPPAP